METKALAFFPWVFKNNLCSISFKPCVFFSYFFLKICTWLSTSTVARHGITFLYKTIIISFTLSKPPCSKIKGEGWHVQTQQTNKLGMKQSFTTEPMKFIKAYDHIGFYDYFTLWFTLSCDRSCFFVTSLCYKWPTALSEV